MYLQLAILGFKIYIMIKIRVTKIFSFEMAHALWNYDGACRNVHGHSYKLFVTISGPPILDTDNPKNGMVIDFTEIKKFVKSAIEEKFDHALVISKEAYNLSLKKTDQMFEKLNVVDFQPTVENMLIYFSEIIKENVHHPLQLHSLKLQETDTSFAEWYAGDNE